MKKNILLYIILLVFLAMCKKMPPAVVEIPENNNINDEKSEDKVYDDQSEVSTEIHFDKIFSNEKYIVLEKSLFAEVAGLWYSDGFRVYEYDKNLEITEYKDSGNKLYELGGGPYNYEGIYDDLLFIDEGTDPGVRGIHIFDLAKKEKILDAAYYRSYSFKNNIVKGLIMSDSKGYDDNIKTRFYELEQDTEILENNDGLSIRFVVDYDFNVLTKEIHLNYGTYIFEQ